MSEIQNFGEEEEVEILFDEDDNVLYPEELQFQGEIPFDDNLAERVDSNVLSEISSKLVSFFNDDVSSREDW